MQCAASLPPELVELLRHHVVVYGTGPDGRLFRTYRGGIYHPSTLWRVLQAARPLAFASAQVTSPLPPVPMTSGMQGSPGGSILGCQGRRWPSGLAIAWRSFTGSMRTAWTGTTRAGTSGWRRPLVRLKALVTKAQEVGSGQGRCCWRHSAYIPGTPTADDIWRRMAAHDL
jgi:hypothetical protein